MSSPIQDARSSMSLPSSEEPPRFTEIDVLHEHVIPLREASKYLPAFTKGRPVSRSTLWRWVLQGRLRSAVIGSSRRVTSLEAIQEMGFRESGSPNALRPSESRSAAIDEAECRLASEGL